MLLYRICLKCIDEYNPPTPPGVERVGFRGMTFILQPHPFILQPLLSIHPAIYLAVHASHPKLPAATWCHPSSHPCTPYPPTPPGVERVGLRGMTFILSSSNHHPPTTSFYPSSHPSSHPCKPSQTASCNLVPPI